MTEFNPNKLFVTYKNGISAKTYSSPRKYTLTHSDLTGDLFLTIDKDYDYDSIGPMRDEVLAEWVEDGNNKVLDVFLQVDGKLGLTETIIRDSIFRKELPLALTAIVYGDGMLIEGNKELTEGKVRVHFISDYPEYNSVEPWGIISDYRYKQNRIENENLKHGYFPTPYPQYPYPPIPPVIPIPMPIPKPQPKLNFNRRIIEDAFLTMLDPYIRRQVDTAFGKNNYYCLKKAQILDAKIVNMYSKCTDEYEIVVGLMVGKNPPPYNNMIIRFLISEDVVKVIDVKNPRN